MKSLMPIGKYKGQPIEAIIEDKQYMDWLCQQAWFREKYCDTYNIIINNFQEPTETPEHNRLQALFLDSDLQMQIINKTLVQFYNIKEKVIYKIKELCKERNSLRFELQSVESWKKSDIQSYIESKSRCIKMGVEVLHKLKQGNIQNNQKIYFEDKGYDVILTMENEYHNCAFDPFIRVCDSFNISFGIEIKPIISDDYPAILRQIKMAGPSAYKILIYDKCSAQGASIEQIKAIFACSGIYVLSFADILGHEVL